jgi:hypothetical protein
MTGSFSALADGSNDNYHLNPATVVFLSSFDLWMSLSTQRVKPVSGDIVSGRSIKNNIARSF